MITKIELMDYINISENTTTIEKYEKIFALTLLNSNLSIDKLNEILKLYLEYRNILELK